MRLRRLQLQKRDRQRSCGKRTSKTNECLPRDRNRACELVSGRTPKKGSRRADRLWSGITTYPDTCYGDLSNRVNISTQHRNGLKLFTGQALRRVVNCRFLNERFEKLEMCNSISDIVWPVCTFPSARIPAEALRAPLKRTLKSACRFSQIAFRNCERQGVSLMALTLRLTVRCHGHQTVVLKEISTHRRSGERGYV